MSLYMRVKDPIDKLDYGFDLAKWLADDVIATATWAVPAGITKVAESNTTTVTRVWVSGGTAGEDYDLEVTVTTAAGRTWQRTITLKVRNN